MLQFVALKDFFSDETKSQYVAGMTYTVRPGNEKLRKLAEAWQAEGRVAFNAVLANRGQVGGSGEVL